MRSGVSGKLFLGPGFCSWAGKIRPNANYKIKRRTNLNFIVVRNVLDIVAVIILSAWLLTPVDGGPVEIVLIVVVVLADFLDGQAGRELAGCA